MQLKYLNRVADANSSNGGNQQSNGGTSPSDELLNQAKKDGAKAKPAADKGPGDEGKVGTNLPDQNQGSQSGTETGTVDQTNQQSNGDGLQGAQGENQPGTAEADKAKPGNDINDDEPNAAKYDVEAEKKNFIKEVADGVIDHIKNSGVVLPGVTADAVPAPAGNVEKTPEQIHDAKVYRFGSDYVDAEKGTGKAKQITTFTAKAWKNLKDKNGWKAVVKTPPEVANLKK